MSDVQGVGDYRQVLQLHGLQMPGDLQRGGPIVQDDGLALADQPCRRLADPGLLGLMHARFEADWIVLGWLLGAQCAAVGADHAAGSGECIQIGSRGHRGDFEAPDDIGDRNAASLGHQIQNLATAFFHQ